MENKKVVILVIVLLALSVLAEGGYIVYQKFFVPKKEEENTIKIGDIDVEPNGFYQIDFILNKLDTAFNYEDSEYFGYIYKNKRLKVEDFSKEAALYASIRSDMVPTAVVKSVPEAKVKATYEKIFGKALKYEIKTIPKQDQYHIAYNEPMAAYDYIATDTRQAYQSGIMAINAKTTVSEGQIIVSRKIFYGEFNADETGKIKGLTIYNNINKEKKLGAISLTYGVSDTEILAKFASKLSNYDYTFTESSNGKSYNLSLIERKN